jgi:hypothetical protein
MKKCNKCNYENSDESVFCAGCGSPLEQAPAPVEEAPAAEEATQVVESAPVTADEPAAQPVPVQTFDSSAYSAPVTSAAPAESNKATLWLILNIVATVLCCCMNVFGIVGIIFAAIGMGSYKKGNYEDMKKKSKIAMILFFIAIASVVLFWILSIVSPMLLSFIPFMSNIQDITGGYYN